MSRQDYDGAEKHLLYWLNEAEREKDLRSKLLINNELIGYYRKTNRRDKAFKAVHAALELINILQIEGTVSSGTTFVNAATAYHAFGEYTESLVYFEKARSIYESSPQIQKHLLGGLYNNMAISYQALGCFSEAYTYFDKALDAMTEVENGKLEQAITYMNIADTVCAQQGLQEGEEKISSLLDQAYSLLSDESLPRDGYYAFVCEKCAPGFSYFGYFAAAEELKEEAKRIYERT